MRKGIVTIQFNWILVLISGAVIMVFFVSVINWATKLQEEKTNVVILNTVSTITNSIKSGDRLDKIFRSVPEADILYKCFRSDQGTPCTCSLSIGGRALNLDDPSIILFAPTRMRVPNILSKSQEWNSPFRIANFLYFTSTNVRYIFVRPTANEQLKKDILEASPSLLKADEHFDDTLLDDFVDKNDDRLKFVFINTDPADYEDLLDGELSDMKDEDVNAVWIKPDPTRTVTFYRKNEDEWKMVSAGDIPYYDITSLVGAVFSEENDKEGTENYFCMLQKSFETQHYAVKAIKKRAENISGVYTSNVNCRNTYVNAIANLQALEAATIDPYSHTEVSVGTNLIPSVEGAATALGTNNDQALLYSCALIY
ncbi:hypothetical protein ACFLZX_01605 [Nanoarchaeota archaeon]